MNLVSISTGNAKLGKVMNVSLIPGKDCGNCSACIKDCYALKFYRMYPSVKQAWNKNSAIARSNSAEYFREVAERISRQHPKYFRWHVAGDILDQGYLNNMVRIAQEFPRTRFVAFTKMYELDYSRLPENLTVRLSTWPGLSLNNKLGLPLAEMLEKGEQTSKFVCGGDCRDCKHCWGYEDVVFFKHR